MYTPNNILSVGLKNEFLLFDHISEIYLRTNYLVVNTPQNLKDISANFLLFKDATLLIFTEKDSKVEHVYTILGFKVKEDLLALYRYPDKE